MPEVILTLPKFKPKQQVVFDSKATEILFAGDTRSGKSFYIRRAYIIFASQIPGLQLDIFRLHFDDVISENMHGETSFPILLDAWEKAGLVKITQTDVVFWNESRVSLEHCADDIVMMKHQGIAKHVRTFGECCQILERRIRALTGWVTMSQEMKDRVPEKWKGLFPKVYHVGNPIGVSSGYYTRKFVDMRPAMHVEKVGQFMRQYIPAYLEDNDSEDAEMTRARIIEAFPDKATQQALLHCDWHQRTGEFFPEWDEERHVIPDLTPPSHYTRFRGYDWGTFEPSACVWAAVSDGEAFRDDEHRERWFPRGALIIYNEWYTCDMLDPSKGLRLRNEEMAEGILNRSEYGCRNAPTLTDSLPFQDRGGETIAQTFQRTGCILTQADTSRVPGWAQLRSRLIGIQIDSNDSTRYPMIYFTESCKYCRDYLPALSRHPSESKKEDAVEHGEATHICDAIRYVCMAHSIVTDSRSPMTSRISKELAIRPTLKKILGGKLNAHFN